LSKLLIKKKVAAAPSSSYLEVNNQSQEELYAGDEFEDGEGGLGDD
jgi:hypothetical protein